MTLINNETFDVSPRSGQELMMKSVLSSVRRVRSMRRLMLGLSLALTAACLPFISHGQLQETETAQRATVRPAGAKHRGAAYVPGSVLVRFRTDAAAQTAEAAGGATLSPEAGA